MDITPYSTFRLQSKARELITVTSLEMLQDVFATHNHEDIVVIGSGSNSLFSKYVDKTMIHIGMSDIAYHGDGKTVTVAAGMVWDDFVLDSIEKGYSGLESLSAIPGTVGAAPIQNIGAYGAEVSHCITSIQAYDIEQDTFITLSAKDCHFQYRTSNFKTIWKGKYVIVSVTFFLDGKETVSAKTAMTVREETIAIRQAKLPDPRILPNVGSFFHNPIVPVALADTLQRQFPDMPIFAADDPNMKKLSAGWLIEQCGWKGYREGPVGMYEKHALVMMNYHNATIDDVLALQKKIEGTVAETFDVTLVREPAIVA